MKSIRFPIFSRRKRLLGYWYLRKRDGEYLVTFKYPGQDHKIRKTDDPEDAVAMFYESYIRYLANDYRQIEDELAKVPKREYVRRGFRKGWASKLHSKLQRKKKGLISKGRKALLQKLATLKEQGWPTPPLPPLPWEKIDGTKAAVTAWVRRVGSKSVPGTRLPDQLDMQEVQSELQQGSGGTGEASRTNTRAWDLHAAGRRSPVFQIDRGVLREPRERLTGISVPREAGKEIWGKPGTSTSDSGEVRDADRSGASGDAQASEEGRES